MSVGQRLLEALCLAALIAAGAACPASSPRLPSDTISDSATMTPVDRPPVELRFYPQVAAPDLDALERRLHEEVNRERVRAGLSALAFEPRLAGIARAYSSRLARAGELTHTLGGSQLGQRYAAAGYRCEVATATRNRFLTGAENLAMTPQVPRTRSVNFGPAQPDLVRDVDEIARVTVDGWMGSRGHRANILTPEWRRQGIGVVIDREHRIWITQNFC